jgi:hypothetical protein
MAQTTEAACLLESGAGYPERLGFRLRTKVGEPILFGLKPGGFSVYFGDEPIYHFDFEGRWQRAFVGQDHFLRGLDGRIRSIERVREAGSLVLKRRSLPFAEAADLDARVRAAAVDLIAAIRAGKLEPLAPSAPGRPVELERVVEYLDRVTTWDAVAWFAHRERYLETYGPMPFRPPDASGAVVFQSTLGNASGRAFGGGLPAPFHARSLAEFDRHVQDVVRLHGRRLAQAKAAFLGGPDVFAAPLENQLHALETIGQALEVRDDRLERAVIDEDSRRISAIHGFLDDIPASLPNADGWRQLHERHLTHVTFGLESGDSRIRARFSKSWLDRDLRSLVANLKAAGIRVGIVVLAGLEGEDGLATHVEASTRLINELELDRSDLVSIINIHHLARQGVEGLVSLEPEAAEAQAVELRQRLGGTSSSKRPRVVVYNPEKQPS